MSLSVSFPSKSVQKEKNASPKGGSTVAQSFLIDLSWPKRRQAHAYQYIITSLPLTCLCGHGLLSTVSR